MSDTIISEYKMKTQKESNSDGRIEDVLTTRILILTLAAIKAGKVAEEKTDRNHATGSADGRPTMIATLKITRITLTGIIIASGSLQLWSCKQHRLWSRLGFVMAQC